MTRMVCKFSCGAASAVATKLILASHSPEEVVIVNAFIKEEHPDNRRFFSDCERWFSHPIIVLKDEKYGASVDEVWRRKRYIKGFRGAPCSSALKRELLATVDQPGDVKVLGFTREESSRFEDLCERFPEENFRAPLIEFSLSKEDCFGIIQRAGIELPMMYRLGYQNANCVGCPKGGQAYWQNIRKDFPERFIQIQAIQESLGPGANFLRFRSGPKKEQRMSLRDLPEGIGSMKEEPSFSCSFVCEMVSDSISGRE